MNIYRGKHDNVPESPVRTLYGRKGTVLLLPLDVCILQKVNDQEEFRPSYEETRLIAAPVQDEADGRIGTIAKYRWPPRHGRAANPVVKVQIAPSANLKGVEDLRVLASWAEVDDEIVCNEDGATGVITHNIGWCIYPDLANRVRAYRVEFRQHVANRTRGAAVRLKNGGLIGMLIATQNGVGDDLANVCRALVYPA